jgi:hypothetical protein
VLSSSVGHGGASGYLAAMALFNVAPETMRPASLTLNIFVATIGLAQFQRAGRFSRRFLGPSRWLLAGVEDNLPCHRDPTIVLPDRWDDSNSSILTE